MSCTREVLCHLTITLSTFPGHSRNPAGLHIVHWRGCPDEALSGRFLLRRAAGGRPLQAGDGPLHRLRSSERRSAALRPVRGRVRGWVGAPVRGGHYRRRGNICFKDPFCNFRNIISQLLAPCKITQPFFIERPFEDHPTQFRQKSTPCLAQTLVEPP